MTAATDLHELVLSLRRQPDRDEILRALVRHAGAVGGGHALVWLRDGTRPVLLSHGGDPDSTPLELPLGAPVPAARAFLERRPVVEAPPAPTVAVPIFEGKRTVGSLTVARDGQGAAFGPDEIAALEMALDVVALAMAAISAAPPGIDSPRSELLASVSAEIAGSEDLDQIVERTLAATGRLFGTERAAVWLIEAGGAPPRAIYRGLPEDFIRAVNDSYGQNVNWTSLQALRPVLIRDLSNVRATMLHEQARRAGVRSALTIPLGFRGQLVGVLGLYSDNFWPWSDEEVETARSFGLQLGGALAHSKLVSETRRQLARLDALAEVGRAAIETSGLERRCRRVVRTLVRSGEVERVGIYLIDAARGELVLAAHEPPGFPARERISLSEDLMLTRAVTGGRIVTTEDDIPEYTREKMRTEHITHGATLPLVRHGKVTGVIAVAKQRGRISPDALDFVRAVADQLVGSIEVERVFDEHAAASARLRAILACAPEGVLVLSADARVAYANAPFLKIFSYEGDITGWTFKDFMREMGPRLEDPGIIDRIRHHVVDEPDLHHRDEFVIARPVRRVVERISAPVVGLDGQRIGQIVIYHDVTAFRS